MVIGLDGGDCKFRFSDWQVLFGKFLKPALQKSSFSFYCSPVESWEPTRTNISCLLSLFLKMVPFFNLCYEYTLHTALSRLTTKIANQSKMKRRIKEEKKLAKLAAQTRRIVVNNR